MEDEHHMPPNEKPQLSSAEIALIKSWIDEGAQFDKAIKELQASFKNYGLPEFNAVASDSGTTIIPSEEVPAADANAIATLTAKGVLVSSCGIRNQLSFCEFCQCEINH